MNILEAGSQCCRYRKYSSVSVKQGLSCWRSDGRGCCPGKCGRCWCNTHTVDVGVKRGREHLRQWAELRKCSFIFYVVSNGAMECLASLILKFELMLKTKGWRMFKGLRWREWLFCSGLLSFQYMLPVLHNWVRRQFTRWLIIGLDDDEKIFPPETSSNAKEELFSDGVVMYDNVIWPRYGNYLKHKMAVTFSKREKTSNVMHWLDRGTCWRLSNDRELLVREKNENIDTTTPED